MKNPCEVEARESCFSFTSRLLSTRRRIRQETRFITNGNFHSQGMGVWLYGMYNNTVKHASSEISIKWYGRELYNYIVACFELGKRLLKDKKAKIYLKPKEIWEELKDLRDHKKEHFVIFYLDSRNQEIKREIISVGSLNANLVHPREVFEPVVKNSVAQIILAHNHPSGDPEPSEDDLEITKRLVESGKILGIEVVDHIIITKTGFISFKEKNLL